MRWLVALTRGIACALGGLLIFAATSGAITLVHQQTGDEVWAVIAGAVTLGVNLSLAWEAFWG